MSFLNKMKSSLNQVKDKAQQTVETTRLSAQISAKRKEKTTKFTELGEIVHRAYCAGELSEKVSQIDELSKAVLLIDEEIEHLEQQLLKLKGEKTCTCGAVVGYDSKFCNSCGQTLQHDESPQVYDEPTKAEVTEAQSETIDQPSSAVKLCHSCQSPIEDDSRFCTSCGAKAE
ncbi:zinc ribbon domain-containing protein [Paenibacillus jiagnxiensis]|uniref:zinc ribbon domain-containing protein n=1 Tax=Paenibacillus jiagnxiensis TaxID=3228926 RepID=UPI0033A8174A